MILVGEKRCSSENINLRYVMMSHHDSIHKHKHIQCLSTISLLLTVRKSPVQVPRPGGSAFVSFPRHWLVSTEHLSFLCGMAMMLTLPCSPRRFVHAHCIRAHSDLFQHTNIFKHALLHESHCPCSRGIYGSFCSICPIEVRKSTRWV